MDNRIKYFINLAATLIIIFSLLFFQIPRTYATGNLTTVRDYLSRQQAGLTTGIQHEIFFTTGSAVSGGTGANKIILTFPNDSANNTKWCRTVGSLTVTGIAEPTGTTVVGESATALPGSSLAGTCAQSSPDTFTITGVDNLSATTKYALRFVGSVGVLGTGDAANNIKMVVKTNNGTTDVDTFVMATSLVAADQYIVSANIDATLTVTLSATTLNLGVLSPGAVSYQGITSTVSTSADGYVSLIKYSGAFSNGVDTIADSGTTVTEGTSGFGASTTKSSQTLGTSNVSPACTTSLQTTTGGPFVASSLSTTFQQYSSAVTPTSLDQTTLCFLAAISGTQASGSYNTTVSLVTTARF